MLKNLIFIKENITTNEVNGKYHTREWKAGKIVKEIISKTYEEARKDFMQTVE